jgi:hypothetical protein
MEKNKKKISKETNKSQRDDTNYYKMIAGKRLAKVLNKKNRKLITLQTDGKLYIYYIFF